MRFLTRLLLALLLALAPADARMVITNVVSSSPPPTFGIDGIVDTGPSGNVTGTSATLNLTTTHTNDVIIVVVNSSVALPTTVNGTGLTFTLQTGWSNSYSGDYMAIYYAIATSTLSAEAITVNFAASNGIMMQIFGVYGANTTTPFNGTIGWADNGSGGDAALPSVTTTVAGSMVIGAWNQDNIKNPSAGTGWTLISSAYYTLVEYAIKASTGTYTPAESTSDTWLAAAFAISPS